MNGTKLRISQALVLVGLAFSSLACVVTVDAGRYSGREEKQWKVTGVPDVTLITFDGSVVVRSWDKSEVRIEIERRAQDKAMADKIQVVAEQAGQAITVEAKKPAAVESFFGLKQPPSARIIATVPERCNLVVRSGDGSITVDRVEGRVELHTDDGSMKGQELRGTLKAHSGDGTVRFEDLDGAVDIYTGDGSAELAGRLTTVRLRTGDGRLTVRAEDGSAMSEDWEIRTGDGSVRLELPEKFSANLDATTGDGRITLEGLGEDEATPARQEDERASLRRPLGSGGKTLRVRTGSGGITLRKY